jgi:hypothetical protein
VGLARSTAPRRREGGAAREALHLAQAHATRGSGEESFVRWSPTRVLARVRRLGEQGMTTAEYAVGTIAACAFAAVLLAVVRSGGVRAALESIITTALGTGT